MVATKRAKCCTGHARDPMTLGGPLLGTGANGPCLAELATEDPGSGQQLCLFNDCQASLDYLPQALAA